MSPGCPPDIHLALASRVQHSSRQQIMETVLEKLDLDMLIGRIMEQAGHNSALGIRVGDVGPNWAEFHVDWREDLVADRATGIFASGPIISLMDSACGVSVWRAIPGITSCVTLDLRIDYLRPARPGRRVTGRAECYHVTKRIAFVRGTAHDGEEDRPVAHVTGTFVYAREDEE